jgi:hypothetical protein
VKRWDLLLLLAGLLVVVGCAGFDWRVGLIVAGVALGGAWYWLAETDEEG